MLHLKPPRHTPTLRIPVRNANRSFVAQAREGASAGSGAQVGALDDPSQWHIARFINPSARTPRKGLAFGSKESVCTDDRRAKEPRG
jgi:hypothetical protein